MSLAAIALSAALSATPARAAGVQADPAAAAFDARMAASARAAERLQGELDGRWRLVDARGRLLFVFEISDPPQHAGPLQGAWRRPDGGASGFVTAIARAGGRLTLDFDDAGRSARLVALGSRAGSWRGWLAVTGRPRLRVTLRR